MFLFKFFRMRGSWIEADNKTLTTSWGKSVALASIDKVDKVKWEKKGIAKLFYTDDAGRRATLIIDDFKYEREPTGKILDKAIKSLNPEQVVMPYSSREDDEMEDDE